MIIIYMYCVLYHIVYTAATLCVNDNSHAITYFIVITVPAIYVWITCD